jgi:hypothetical protein
VCPRRILVTSEGPLIRVRALLYLQIAVFAVAITIALVDPSGWTFAAAVLAGAALILATRLL